MAGRSLLVEADGGSRGNPGPAGYGAVVKDAATGEVLAERAAAIGRATNNVAEYEGLLAGLEAARSLDPQASVEVRMDSKLVVEQMSGGWKIKHDDMRRLATRARRILPVEQVTYTWIPRALNGHADRLANEAMDAAARGETWESSVVRPRRDAADAGAPSVAAPSVPAPSVPAPFVPAPSHRAPDAETRQQHLDLGSEDRQMAPIESHRSGPTPPVVPPAPARGLRPDTLAVRGGVQRSGFMETSEALYLTSGFVYDSAADAEAAFAGDVDRFVYSRYGNPTVATFEERMRLIEGAEAAFATASGMSAVFTALAALLKAGDRVVAARSLFGSCFVILDEILPRWGVVTEFVDGSDLAQWEKALSTPAAAVFFESPSNPMMELVDVRAVCDLAHAAGAQVVLDNVFATPVLQRSLDLGADVVVYSATKHIDGQGRVLGGAVLGSKEFVDGPVKNLMRHTGPAMSPFNAWVLTKGLETMAMRVRHSTAGALRVAGWLEQQPQVAWVKYPHLPSHPQHELALRQMSGGGTVVTFELAGGAAAKDTAFAFLDALNIVDISNNLGDSKSLITHPATTTHRRLGPQGRAKVGITDGLVRLSIGLEDVEDLLEDLDQALRSR